MITGKYPGLRLRRSRKNDWSRRLIEENNLTPNDFILPIFLIDGKNKKQSISSMPFFLKIETLVYFVTIKGQSIVLVAKLGYTHGKI